MKTGFSLLEILHRENPVFITGMGLQCTFNWWRCTYHLSNLILLVRKFLHIDNYLYNNSLTPSLPKTRHFDTTWNFEVSHFDSTFVCSSYIPSSKLKDTTKGTTTKLRKLFESSEFQMRRFIGSRPNWVMNRPNDMYIFVWDLYISGFLSYIM